MSDNREKATTLLKALHIKQAPVEIEKIANFLGFKIVRYPFPDQLRGMVRIRENQMVKIIGVNEKHPDYLQRYTIAHELGHYLNGHEHIEKGFIDDDTRFYDSHFQQEKDAYRFAAELLMPKYFLEQDLKILGLNIETLIKKYEVSEQAMWIRLTSLRLAEKYSVI